MVHMNLSGCCLTQLSKLFAHTEGSSDGVQSRVLSTLLNEMDGIEKLTGILVLVSSLLHGAKEQ